MTRWILRKSSSSAASGRPLGETSISNVCRPFFRFALPFSPITRRWSQLKFASPTFIPAAETCSCASSVVASVAPWMEYSIST